MVVLFRIYEVRFKYIFDKILFLHGRNIRISVLYVKGILPYAGGVVQINVCPASLGFVREMCTVQSRAANLFECNNISKLVLVCS